MRNYFTIVPRYINLLLILFLLISGLTGRLLAFNNELRRWLIQSILTVPISKVSSQDPFFDPFTLHERTVLEEPHAQIDWFDLTFH